MNPFTDWTSLDYWTVATAATCAVACALLGCFLMLRKLSMMGDAISHALLPGLVLGFLFTGSRDPLPMLLGAAVMGLLTAWLSEWLRSAGGVDEGASMGVVFTALFAFGLLLVVRYADRIDLDPSCVLYGQLESVALTTIKVVGFDLPRAFVTLAIVLVLDVIAVVFFYKELTVTSFDPSFAKTRGIPPRVMHFALMTLVAITTVASFEAVGSILVVAMLMVPAATAYLLTSRLWLMLLLATVFAVLSAGLGHWSAINAPTPFGLAETTTSGMMAVVAGLMLTVAVVFSPTQGVLWRALRRARSAPAVVPGTA